VADLIEKSYVRNPVMSDRGPVYILIPPAHNKTYIDEEGRPIVILSGPGPTKEQQESWIREALQSMTIDDVISFGEKLIDCVINGTPSGAGLGGRAAELFEAFKAAVEFNNYLENNRNHGSTGSKGRK
jgi:hypothetical protein